MSWANKHIEKLINKEIIKFRPHGNSMQGIIESGQLVTVEPIEDVIKLKINDIVLCKVNGQQYLHIIKDIKDDKFQIGNNKGYINGWISLNSIYGICTKVED